MCSLQEKGRKEALHLSRRFVAVRPAHVDATASHFRGIGSAHFVRHIRTSKELLGAASHRDQGVGNLQVSLCF